MDMERFVRRTRIAAPAERVFHWHETAEAFEKLIPPGERVRVVKRSGGIRDGGRIEIQIGRWPLRVRWIAVHEGYIENRQFRDIQAKGPFRRWEHTHVVEPDGADACYLEDRIEYALPLGAVGRRVAGAFVRRKLEHLFDYRHRVTREENEWPPEPK